MGFRLLKMYLFNFTYLHMYFLGDSLANKKLQHIKYLILKYKKNKTQLNYCRFWVYCIDHD